MRVGPHCLSQGNAVAAVAVAVVPMLNSGHMGQLWQSQQGAIVALKQEPFGL